MLFHVNRLGSARRPAMETPRVARGADTERSRGVLLFNTKKLKNYVAYERIPLLLSLDTCVFCFIEMSEMLKTHGLVTKEAEVLIGLVPSHHQTLVRFQ